MDTKGKQADMQGGGETKPQVNNSSVAGQSAVSSASANSPTSPTSANSNTATGSTPIKQKKSNTGLYLVLGCLGVLVLCCCLTVCGFVVAPSAMVGIFNSSNAGKDENLTTVSQSEVDEIIEEKEAQAGINQPVQGGSEVEELLKYGTVEQKGDTYEVTFTEEEILAALMSNSDTSQFDPDAVGIDIRPGSIKFQISMEEILAASGEDFSEVPVDVTDMYLTIILKANPAGNRLVLDEFSTGNTLLDTMITGEMETSMQEEFDKSMDDIFSQNTLRSIEFKQDELTLVFDKDYIEQQ